MRLLRIEDVDLAEIKNNLFVRQKLDDDHVMYLAGLIEGGKEIEPIELDQDMGMIDGRHRKEAYELCGVKKTKAKILSFASELEKIAYAFKANTNGPKPPTPADIEHTIQLMIEQGIAVKSMGEFLSLPTIMVRKYANVVTSRISRTKLIAAAEAVTEGGLTVNIASQKYGVDLTRLKEHLSGNKKRKNSANGVDELNRRLTANYKNVSMKNAAYFKRLIEQYDDGDVTERQIKVIIQHLESLQKKSARSFSDWKERIEAKFKNRASSVKA